MNSEQAELNKEQNLYEMIESGQLTSREVMILRKMYTEQFTDGILRYNMINYFKKQMKLTSIIERILTALINRYKHERVSFPTYACDFAICLSGQVDRVLDKLFTIIDQDSSNFIDCNELCQMISYIVGELDADDIKSIANEFLQVSDENSDGRISRKEFLQIFEESSALKSYLDGIEKIELID
ncbi:hypothetical protein GJ496_003340 [Pomphorhynchus laevis]|nr:hypothetical protein GJ496_003340 [Pomphorhynchus laevis]